MHELSGHARPDTKAWLSIVDWPGGTLPNAPTKERTATMGVASSSSRRWPSPPPWPSGPSPAAAQTDTASTDAVVGDDLSSILHGSSFVGDGAVQHRALADDYERRFDRQFQSA